MIVVVEADSAEWSDLATGAVASIEERLKKELVLGDLKVVRLLQVVREQGAAGLSFSDFRKAYKPPVPIYSCVCCEVGESRVAEEMVVKEFFDAGGRILLTGRLSLGGE